MPSEVWDRILGNESTPEGDPFPPMPLPWYERGTALTHDCFLALETLGCTLPEYYARTTPLERQLYRLYFAVRAAKMEFAQEAARHEQERLSRSQPPTARG